ncbi:uncharacterized protein LOC131695403 [Topomyia yanbarensis]|uniref:uncharacterized protein LOC131695403 n=1 Tax=Topomyia yanbarensis TaxID=2498891 RepID=UPI00273AE571|nr:uncharacterized protein LOC131695403 [Topomyia yanbarensis]
MLYPLLVLLNLLLLGPINFVDCGITEVHLDRFEQLNGFHIANFSAVRVRKFNRTTAIMDGEGELFIDLNERYQFSLTVSYSTLGNNQWNEYPMKVSKDNVCKIMNGIYKDYQSYFVESTNMPRVGDEWFCPYPKGRYWIRNFVPRADWVPDVIPAGYWRFTTMLFDPSDDVLIKCLIFMKIKKGYF